MSRSLSLLGVATATLFVCSLYASVVTAGTLKAAAAEAINDPTSSNSKFEARGLSPPLHGNEVFTGPTAIALALPIALLLIVALWVAAYNTLRSPPPKIGYNAGIVEQAGWGGAQANIAGGYGTYEAAAATDQHAVVASNLAGTTLVQAAATQGAVATGRAFDELTHRVTRSIARKH